MVSIKEWLGVTQQPPPSEAFPIEVANTPASMVFRNITEARKPFGGQRDRGRGGVFTLSGHSGTGKSTLVRKLCADLGPRGRAGMMLTAPTNKAAKVLRHMLEDEYIYDVPCCTIHKANGLTMANDREEKYLVRSGEGEASESDLVVVDEASMVGERMFELVVERLVSNGVAVLFVGDPYQLAPVKDGEMRAFDPATVPNQARLTEIVRQARGHPVIQLGDYFRRKIDGEKNLPFPKSGKHESGAGVFYLPSIEFYRTMMAHYVDNRDDPGAVRALAWTNRTVDDLAYKARAALHGEHAPKYIAGERMFTAKPWEDMHTDQECVIRKIAAVEAHPLYADFDGIPIQVELDGGFIQQGWAPGNEGLVKREVERLREVAFKAQGRARQSNDWRDRQVMRECWKAFHGFQESFIDLRSVHAITAHRSQGSTFESVFVDAKDIKRASEKFRLLYVACTRARSRVYIRES